MRNVPERIVLLVSPDPSRVVRPLPLMRVRTEVGPVVDQPASAPAAPSSVVVAGTRCPTTTNP